MSDFLDFKKCLKIGQIFEKKTQMKIILNCYSDIVSQLSFKSCYFCNKFFFIDFTFFFWYS